MKLYCDRLMIEGTPMEGVDPQPYFRNKNDVAALVHDETFLESDLENFGVGNTERNLPYCKQDRFNRELKPIELKTIVLENEHLIATFLPEYGARLWSLYSKDEQRELLFKNPVFRLSNVANRIAWFSGGIEWNLGHTGHFAFTSDNVYCAKLKDDGGNDVLRVYEYEATHAQLFQIDFHLASGAKQLTAHVNLHNLRNKRQLMYWWTNTAVVLSEHTRVFSNTDEIIYQLTPDKKTNIPGFARCKMPYQPNLLGVDISYPSRLPLSVEYFFQNDKQLQSPWEVSIEKNCRGFFERSTQPLFARKMFAWGNTTGGNNWCDYLAKPGEGDYIEVQAGLAPTQNHSKTVEPYEVVSFTQMFGAIEVQSEAQTKEWNEAKEIVSKAVEQTLETKAVLKEHQRCLAFANKKADEMLHYGSIYGLIERARLDKTGEKQFLEHLEFSEELDRNSYLQYKNALLGEQLFGETPIAYNTDPLWLDVLKKLCETSEASAQSLMQYGISLIENGEVSKGEEVLQNEKLKQNPYAQYALGLSKARFGENKQALDYFVCALKLCGQQPDASFVQAVIDIYVKNGEYQKAWDTFESVPTEKQTDKMWLLAAEPAVKLSKDEFLQKAFEKEYATIREGELGVSDVWLEYMSRKECEQKGVEFSSDMIDKTRELPKKMNFRMFGNRGYEQ